MGAPALTTRLDDARPETAAASDTRIQADLARLLQTRLVSESALGVWVHPILIAVVVALAWPNAPHDLLIGWTTAVLLAALLRGAWLVVVHAHTRPDAIRAVAVIGQRCFMSSSSWRGSYIMMTLESRLQRLAAEPFLKSR